MNRGQQIFAYDTLVEHDGILIVVTLPRHVSNQEVTTKASSPFSVA
jgi:hypothetical protein